MRSANPTSPTPAYAAWLQSLSEAPQGHGFYQTLRRIEAAHPHLPRFGQAKRPADEPLRVAQPAELTFAPATLHSVQIGAKGVPTIQQRAFGLLGPNGPLPIHLTELARDRSKHHADPTLQRFLDTFTHRFALQFFRAWAQAQPVLGQDRPGEDLFARRLGSLAGLSHAGANDVDAASDRAKLHFVGRLSRQVRDAEGLRDWCRAELNVPLRVEQWRGHWLPLANDERTRLGGRGLGQPSGCGLGQGAVLGRACWDVQHKFRITIGPLPLARYQEFLPGGAALARLQALVRQWQGLELAWDLNLILDGNEVPALRLQRTWARAGLGHSSWLQQGAQRRDRQDLVLDVDRVLKQQRRRANPSSPSAPSFTIPEETP